MGRTLAVLIALSCVLGCARAPQTGSPQEPPSQNRDAATAWADLVLQRFATGTAAAFDSIYPFPRGRGMVMFAASRELPRLPGIARVAWLDPSGDRAVLVLAGHVEFGNTGDETGYATGFSGVYEARAMDGEWHLTRRLPSDSLSHITRQSLDVMIDPGRGLAIVDTLDVTIHGDYGMAAQLNHAAALHGVDLDGNPADYEFGGGLLWVRAPAGRSRVVVRYELDVARDSATGTNSAHFAPDYGHVRNQYYWHPRGAGWSDFSMVVRAPERLHVATDLPQQDAVEEGVRIVQATSEAPTSALTLLYDAAWQPAVRRVGRSTLALFTTPGFSPDADSIEAEFTRVYDLLATRFGEPASTYFAVAQQRGISGSGWLWRSNDMIGAAADGGALYFSGPPRRAPFGHEVAHGWVDATGPGSNFLGEGWSMFTEAMLLEHVLGADVLPVFWAHQRNLYHKQAFEGRVSIIDDPENSGIAYTKGPWVLRMLEDYIGRDALTRGLIDYMRIPAGQPAGIPEFTAAMSGAAGRDVRPFLRPWIEERVIPHVTASVEDGLVIVTQHGPVFRLPLELDLVTAEDTLRRSLMLAGRQDTLALGDVGAVTAVIVDPRHRLMLRSDRGELARFEVRAPDATRVALVTDFHPDPFEAEAQGEGLWAVTMPLSSGTYLFHWRVDDREVAGGVRVVEPRQQLNSPFPR